MQDFFMPFTFSHPAIILPALKIRNGAVCISALVVGSMAPDFEYFIKMKLEGRFSHTLSGLFLFDLPVTLTVLIIFHSFVKQALISNLPNYFKSRLQPLKDFDFFGYLKKYPVGLVICILLGAASHIVWDGFTHQDGMFAMHLPFLLMPVDIPGLSDFHVYRLSQHISTVVGAIVIFFVFHKMSPHTTDKQIDLRYWTILTFFFTLAMIIRISFGVEYYGDTIVIFISSSMIGLIFASAIFKLFKLNKT